MDLTPLLTYAFPVMPDLTIPSVLKWTLATWFFYIGFAVSVSVYRLWQKGTLNILNKILFAPVLIIFLIADVIINFTLLLVIFGKPPTKTYTITDRLAVYHTTESGFKKTIASFICEKVLNPIDPTGNHC
jgi:hypothetical protein